MTTHPHVTLCIINFNGAQRLPRTLAAVCAQSWRFEEILLVDDASDDDSLEVVQRLMPEIRRLAQASNKGPGAARNAGFAAARNHLILFMDNDIFLAPDTTAGLISHLGANPQALVVAPRVVYDDNPALIQYDSADCHFLGLMVTRNANRPITAVALDPVETDSLVTACFAMDRSRWSGGAPFDESFGFNLEDHDFGMRSRLRGHQLWVHPESSVRHGAGTPGLSYRPGGVSTPARLLYLTANRWMIVGKCFSWRTLLILTPPLLLFELLQCLWLTSNGQFAVWWSAVRSLPPRWHHLRTQRRAIQASRLVGDRNVLKDLPLPFTAEVREKRLAAPLIDALDQLLHGYFVLIRRWL